ncbi:MAG: type pantothenate kinase [Actinomycetota bacterium]|jgi:type III pantothenate kinase
MLLCIDVGNTNIVIGLFDGEELVESFRIATDSRTTADELALKFQGLLADTSEVDGISLCSTVPAVLREMRTMLEKYYAGIPHVVVEPGTKTGVPILTDNPKEVGADRIVNSLAAFTIYGGPAIVVDFGTSTNLDVISAKGEFLGGALAPGVEISIEALASRAAQLRKVELVKPKNVIGKNTVEALQSGAIYGFAGQVDGLVERIIAELGEPVKAVIATGGLASIVVRESQTITHHDPDLTLHGLRMVYERNIG